MVTILSVGLMVLTGMEQERTTSPFRCTEQAPHCATPQPYLVPVRPTCSRITHRSGVLSSTCTSRVAPLMLSFAILSPPVIQPRNSIRETHSPCLAYLDTPLARAAPPTRNIPGAARTFARPPY